MFLHAFRLFSWCSWGIRSSDLLCSVNEWVITEVAFGYLGHWRWADILSQNVGNELPIDAVQHPKSSKTSLKFLLSTWAINLSLSTIQMYRLCYMFQLVRVILWHILHSVPLSLSMVLITLFAVLVGYHPVIFHSHKVANTADRVHNPSHWSIVVGLKTIF